MEVSQSEKIKPRPYQVELFKKAVKEDAIIYLGTGSGKTFIAVMMIKEHLPNILNSQKKIVFLVNTVVLAHQQCAFINKHVPVVTRSFIGEDGVDNWDEKKWKLEKDSCKIMVMINNVFRDALLKRFLQEEELTLIIFDECHHTKKNSPYAQILKVINAAPQEKRPRILGLSASIVSSKSDTNEKFLKELNDLESIMKCKVITTEENLASYLKEVNSPVEHNVFCEQFIINPELEAIFRQFEEEAEYLSSQTKGNKKSKAKKTIRRMKVLIQNLGLYAIKVIKQKENYDLFNEDLDETAFPEDSTLSKTIRDTLGSYYESKEKEIDPTHDGYSPKALELFEIINDYVEKLRENGFKKPPTAIVFTKERATAKALELYLQLNFRDLNIGCMVGNNYKSLPLISSQSSSPSKQKETMEDFKLGKKAIIVATSVLEEGVDVQTCDLVVRFDRIETYQSYVQSKGRARAKESEFVMMVDVNEKVIWEECHKRYQALESKGLENVHGSEKMDDLNLDDSNLIEPYFSQPELGIKSPRLTKYETVSLVYKYVSSLPSDRFTSLVPEFDYQTKSNEAGCKLWKCILILPHGSVHRYPIHGSKFHPTRKVAKEDAAMEACKILHQKGILNNRFQLVKPEKLFSTELEEDDDDDGKCPKPGTKRSRRYYPVRLPPELRNFEVEQTEEGVALKSGRQCYVYRLSLILKEECQFALNVKEYRPYHPEDFPSKLAIVLAQPMPWAGLDNMTLHTVSGTVEAKFEFVRCLNIIPTEVYKSSMLFQAKIIPFILQCTLPWTTPDDASSNYLISILDQDGEFDLSSLKTTLGESKMLKDFSFSQESLEVLKNSVIQPIHVQSDMNYFVEKVLESETSECLIPDQNVTYKKYYLDRYRVDLDPPKQPLITVSNAGKEHFMFRYLREGASNQRSKKPTNKVKYPIGAVKIQPIPASLWREVQMFPFAMCLVQSRISIGKKRLEILRDTRFIERESQKEENLFNKLLQKDSEDIILPNIDDITVALTSLGAAMENNLERLEVIGDSFLKFIVSVGLYVNKTIQKTLFNEGLLTSARSAIIGNRKLYGLMVKRELVELLIIEKFEPHRLWLSPRIEQKDKIEDDMCDLDREFRMKYDDSLEVGRKKLPNATIFNYVTAMDIEDYRIGKLQSDELLKIARDRHRQKEEYNRVAPRENVLISDKRIADSAEALLGLILVRNGHLGTLEFMHWLGIDLSPQLSLVEIVQGKCIYPATFDWYLKTDQLYESHLESESALSMLNVHLDKANANAVEKRLGYSFKNRFLLLQALTHGSYSSNVLTSSFESLEFLGDAVIDYLVTAYLYSEDESLNPGQLTEMRSMAVCNNTLALMCIKNMFHKSILHQCPQLLGQIEGYLNIFEECRLDSKNDGRVNFEGAFKDNMKLINEEDGSIIEAVEIPKVLGDIVESLIGAVYLDSGRCLLTTWKSLKLIFMDDIKEVIKSSEANLVKLAFETYPGGIKFEKRPPRKGKSVCCAVVRLRHDQEPKEFYGCGKNIKLAKVAAARSFLRTSASLG